MCNEMNNRRNFMKKGLALGAGMGSLPLMGMPITNGLEGKYPTASSEVLTSAAAQRPILKKKLFKDPLIIKEVDLLQYRDNFICRVRTQDGAEGISVSNNLRMVYLYPIFIKQVAPFFIGKDARDLELLLEGVYLYKSNYKMQNYALWVPVATIEFAILDLLGKISEKPIGALVGSIEHKDISVYQANNFRGRSARESIQLIQEQMEETSSKALKFKIGGRMSNNADHPPGRTEELIPLIRSTFGSDMVVYADSNGSYTPEEAIRIGRLMEDHAFDFYEEPVPFDWYQETLAVNKALRIPIAGGEQEASMHNFKWLIDSGALDIVQPDIFYFGGMVRSMKVASMAAAVGKTCVPHISGSGLGYLYMMHFVSALTNAGPYHEFKGFNQDIPVECPTSDLTIREGRIQVPKGPGLGVQIDPVFLSKHKKVELPC